MMLYHWRGDARNFGDELNIVLWPRLLPNFFDDDPSERFVGIGSVLDCRHDGAGRKLVAGAGYGGYEAKPDLSRDWDILWVRGPRTAAALGLPPELGIGDPAQLLPSTGLVTRRCTGSVGFMPHFESLGRGAWAEAAAANNIELIDPRGDPLHVADRIGHCSVLVTEAMHGAIVADALGVPWIAVEPLVPTHRPKWADWADTLGLTIRFHRLPPTTLLEAAHASRIGRTHPGRVLLTRHRDRLWRLGRTWLVDRAALALRHVALQDPQLSDRAALARCQDAMQQRLERLKSRPLLSAVGSAKEQPTH